MIAAPSPSAAPSQSNVPAAGAEQHERQAARGDEQRAVRRRLAVSRPSAIAAAVTIAGNV